MGNPLHVITHLAPYSPFLNSIDSVFLKLKSKIHKETTANQNYGKTTIARIEITKKIIAYELEKHDFKNLSSFFWHN